MFTSGSGKPLGFPPVCACCGQNPPTTEEAITSSTSDQSGNYVRYTSDSIKVPMCQKCKTALKARRRAVRVLTWLLWPVLLVVVYCLIKAHHVSRDTPFIMVLGLIGAGIVQASLRKLFNLEFAWIVGQGTGLRFSNPRYQGQYDEYQTKRTTPSLDPAQPQQPLQEKRK